MKRRTIRPPEYRNWIRVVSFVSVDVGSWCGLLDEIEPKVVVFFAVDGETGSGGVGPISVVSMASGKLTGALPLPLVLSVGRVRASGSSSLDEPPFTRLF